MLISLTIGLFAGGAALLKVADARYRRIDGGLQTLKKVNETLIGRLDDAERKLTSVEKKLADTKQQYRSLEFPVALFLADRFIFSDEMNTKGYLGKSEVRKKLQEIFKSIEPESALRVLLSIDIEEISNPGWRNRVRELLEELITEESRSTLLSIARDPNTPDDTRRRAVASLSLLPSPDAVSALASIVDDESARPDLRKWAAEVLPGLGEGARAAFPRLRRMKDGNDPSLAAVAAAAMDKIGLGINQIAITINTGNEDKPADDAVMITLESKGGRVLREQRIGEGQHWADHHSVTFEIPVKPEIELGKVEEPSLKVRSVTRVGNRRDRWAASFEVKGHLRDGSTIVLLPRTQEVRFGESEASVNTFPLNVKGSR